MKRILSLATLMVFASATAAFAASPEAVIAVASCCAALTACRGAGSPCCPYGVGSLTRDARVERRGRFL